MKNIYDDHINIDDAKCLDGIWMHQKPKDIRFHWIYKKDVLEAFDDCLDTFPKDAIIAPSYNELMDYIVLNKKFIDLTQVELISDPTYRKKALAGILINLIKNIEDGRHIIS